MQEDFLHFVWKYKRFQSADLKTVEGLPVHIIHLGQHNHNAGPDFFNAQLIIDNQKWAGNVEIHLKSSDWYVHNHEKDSAYDNVILHVVWEHDTDIYRKDNSVIPTLELQQYIKAELLNNYKNLLSSKSWINCEKDFHNVDDFILNNWIERLYFERLEQKSKSINALLSASKNNWEAVLFKMLCKNFGLKVNGQAFLSLANSVEFSVVRKTKHSFEDLEALFFGQCNLLNDDIQDGYFLDLKKRYVYLKQKFNLANQGVLPLQFFRLRPPNFPTIRLSQLAQVYNKEDNLFSKLMNLETVDDYYEFFNICTSAFWETHYTFSKTSKRIKKNLSKSFIDLLLINTILPLKFSYAKSLGKDEEKKILDLITSIAIEKNSVVDKFLDLKALKTTAMTSQGLIQLKNNYCNKNKCLQCAIGNQLIANSY
ncbi:uncharacterized protein DUF2851 [Winogradskyella wandonensis]|uniref:Uncharacterized protein DUF2851 n=1 Tax=Winogradskyella wandonensis TaxID=1442586 RepID=A0A4R1KPA1_9FLAO|nr:DUF2851 family protein [Winogradskyella wandonensis]TCK66822.1 uncharacterized protein DUF2851 [Winogradskyella wandonensis]